MPPALDLVFDSHVHADVIDTPAPSLERVAEYRAIVPGITPAATDALLTQTPPAHWSVCAAVHPWYLPDDQHAAAELEALESLARDPRVAGVGETGLDHLWLKSDDDRARAARWFEDHLALAAALEKPCVVHCVRAHADCVAILRRWAPKLPGVIVHAFAGSVDEARAYERLGVVLGFGPAVLRPASRRVRAAAIAVPDHQLVVETDAPYMSATDGPGRPDDVLAVIAELARLRGTTDAELARLTAANAARLFPLSGPAASGRRPTAPR
ncbi:MAG: TatD family hydrolase [Myxococcales bacterium]|nr:TatD family hydrolase [Myxococcales bacterium]MCB9530950.1 TatD family hydrolase [Myxococcales bacterium]MCB9532869.1 TatD family hydrolase [Myxococcales bacterium]